MKILLVCGYMHEIIEKYVSDRFEIVNKDSKIFLEKAFDYLSEVNPNIDGILITDGFISRWQQVDSDSFQKLLNHLSQLTKVKIIILTNDTIKQNVAQCQMISNQLEIVMFDFFRVSKDVILTAFQSFLSWNTVDKSFEVDKANENSNLTTKKRKLFERFKSSKPAAEINASDQLTRDFDGISKGISRVVAITGHRGSGLTTTAVNLAHEANKRGLSAILIDMDIEYRGTNAFFDKFNEISSKNEDMRSSLIRMLARPQDYTNTAFRVKDNLWLTSLGYSFNDKKLIEQFYNSTKLISMLSLLRNKFNLVILDIPLDLFKTFQDALMHIDTFGLCVPNNIYSVLSLLRNVEVVLSKENALYLNSKSKVIVTKYNDRAKFQGENLIPDKVCEILTSGISNYFQSELQSAGYIPYSFEYDYQIELDIPAVNNSNEFEKCFGNILLRIMEGVR